MESFKRNNPFEVIRKKTEIKGKKRESFLGKHNYKCCSCGISVKNKSNFHIDHIIPLSKGGSVDENNLQLLCRSCNLKKGKETKSIESCKKEFYCYYCGKEVGDKKSFSNNFSMRLKNNPNYDKKLIRMRNYKNTTTFICDSCALENYIKKFGRICEQCGFKHKSKDNMCIVRDLKKIPFSEESIKKINCEKCNSRYRRRLWDFFK